MDSTNLSHHIHICNVNANHVDKLASKTSITDLAPRERRQLIALLRDALQFWEAVYCCGVPDSREARRAQLRYEAAARIIRTLEGRA